MSPLTIQKVFFFILYESIYSWFCCSRLFLEYFFFFFNFLQYNKNNTTKIKEKRFSVIWIRIIVLCLSPYILFYLDFVHICTYYICTLCVSSLLQCFFFFIIIIFPFHTIFFLLLLFIHFYLEIYYSILCGTLKSHIAFVRLVHHFVWVFMCFSNAKRIAVSTKTPQKYTREGYQYVQSLLWVLWKQEWRKESSQEKILKPVFVMGLASDKNNYYVRPQKKSWIKRRFRDKSKMATFNGGMCGEGFGGWNGKIFNIFFGFNFILENFLHFFFLELEGFNIQLCSSIIISFWVI